jgi:transcriptional regulator with XRE-family HTH domain
MTLKDYLTQHRLTLQAFGDQCGLSAPTVLRIRDGRNIPSRRTLQAIVDATDGAVTVQELIRYDHQ